MTPKLKAKELVDKFTVVGLQQRNEGIQCALIAVDEILSIVNKVYDHDANILLPYYILVPYYEQVKQEIEKL